MSEGVVRQLAEKAMALVAVADFPGGAEEDYQLRQYAYQWAPMPKGFLRKMSTPGRSTHSLWRCRRV